MLLLALRLLIRSDFTVITVSLTAVLLLAHLDGIALGSFHVDYFCECGEVYSLLAEFLDLHYLIGQVEHAILEYSAAGHDISEHEVVVEGVLQRLLLLTDRHSLQEGV